MVAESNSPFTLRYVGDSDKAVGVAKRLMDYVCKFNRAPWRGSDKESIQLVGYQAFQKDDLIRAHFKPGCLTVSIGRKKGQIYDVADFDEAFTPVDWRLMEE